MGEDDIVYVCGNYYDTDPTCYVYVKIKLLFWKQAKSFKINNCFFSFRVDDNLAFTEIASTTNMHRMSAMAWFKE